MDPSDLELEIDRAALLATFCEEARDLAGAMEEHLLALEAAPGDPERLHALFRAAHTLKGGAMTVGLDALSRLAHAAEDLLSRWRAGTLDAAATALVTPLLAAVDAMRGAVADAEAGRPEPAAALEAARGRLAGAATPGPAPAGAAAAPAEEAAPAPADAGPRTLRIEVGRLDHLLDLTGELAVARRRIADALERPGAMTAEELLLVHRESDRTFEALQELVMKARMVPLGPTFHQQQRTVRDVAAALGKRVHLVARGGDVEVDTAIVEAVRDPLGHLVRNAVDHGIEPPGERTAAGKDPAGTVTLEARREGGGVVIELRDDGRGIDRGRVAAAAVRLGLAGDAAQVGEAEAARLLFAPGLSTREAVTAVSGRGVGMDVVRRNVEALRGTVEVESAPGRGTAVTLRLPLALALLRAFRVEVAGAVLVVPLEAVEECVDLPAGPEHDREAAAGVIPLRGAPLPFLRLRRALGLDGPPSRRESVLVVAAGGRRAGLAVDRLLGDGQVVVKPLALPLRGRRGLSGSTVLGDGRVGLVLDVPALLAAVPAAGGPAATA
jgi:two-component system chemotaxis sensor kinase CheA